MLSHCWLGDKKGIQPVKNCILVWCWWQFDWSFAHLTALVVTATSIILSSNNIQNENILVPANPGPPWKQRENVLINYGSKCNMPKYYGKGNFLILVWHTSEQITSAASHGVGDWRCTLENTTACRIAVSRSFWDLNSTNIIIIIISGFGI